MAEKSGTVMSSEAEEQQQHKGTSATKDNTSSDDSGILDTTNTSTNTGLNTSKDSTSMSNDTSKNSTDTGNINQGSTSKDDTSSSNINSSSSGGVASKDETTESSEDEEHEGGALGGLMSYMKQKLNISGPQEPPVKVLSSLDVDGVVQHMKSDNCRNIITMAGAGISTSAGIPDFRSPESGLYNNLQKYNLPYPEAIFELNYFRKNPQPFFTLAKELYPGSFDPTPCHYFIKLLENKGLLLRHFTQNIDTLEYVAGISEDKLVEAHGSFRTAHCIQCRKLYHQNWVKDQLFSDHIPSCTECAGVVKPDIVFFGEGLPDKFFQRLSSDFPSCDLLIIMGTSLTVQPFASLIDNVPASCPRLLINREAVGESDSVMSMLQNLMGKSGGLQLKSPHNTRDVALLGDCDDGCLLLAEKLGWKEELDELIVAGKKNGTDEAKV
uniref:NAD-dependent protein deacetylase Sirt2-like isoform X1 n=2 Tax=Hirondellea gigas TaxID=1518452 RepID=A0A6A7FRQ6_9CRUS